MEVKRVRAVGVITIEFWEKWRTFNKTGPRILGMPWRACPHAVKSGVRVERALLGWGPEDCGPVRK